MLKMLQLLHWSELTLFFMAFGSGADSAPFRHLSSDPSIDPEGTKGAGAGKHGVLVFATIALLATQ
jgi:hypothetical protein